MSGRCRLGALLLAIALLAGGRAWGETLLPPPIEAAWARAAAHGDSGERAVLLSEAFLGLPYLGGTLGGGPARAEQLTVRFDAVDCFTLLDTVEALRRSASPAEFRQRLVEVRYRDGVIAWDHRRHFFTDWLLPGGRVADVTAVVGGDHTQQVVKHLNRASEAVLLLDGVPVRERTIRFVPGAALDKTLLARLRPGDYLGIYTPKAGLDVSHVGIVIRRGSQLLLRHASPPRAAGKVVDTDLASYLEGKPGIVVLRPQ